jgi:acetyl esterase/lipase
VQDGVSVVVGPGVAVDLPNLERWCAEWGDELGTAVRVVPAGDGASVAAAVHAARTAVVAPGEAAGDPDVRGAGAAGEVVWVDLAEAERPVPPYFERGDEAVVRGRGVWGFRWALAWLLQRRSWPFTTIAYGEGRDRFGDLRLPRETGGPFPLAVLIHGGFWRERWVRDTIEPLAIDLARRGLATWNLEYRRVGPSGGGFPASAEDVAAGIDHVAELAGTHPLDLDRVAIVGHSAGGHLALWAAARRGSGRAARVTPRLLVSLAGVPDLAEAARRGLGDTGNGTADFLGGPPEQLGGTYADASPAATLPLGVPQLVVQGRLDNMPDLVDLNRSYARAAREAGDDVEYVELDDADHFHLISPASTAWPVVAERIEARLG